MDPNRIMNLIYPGKNQEAATPFSITVNERGDVLTPNGLIVTTDEILEAQERVTRAARRLLEDNAVKTDEIKALVSDPEFVIAAAEEVARRRIPETG